MNYRVTILHLTQLWQEGTPTSLKAFDELLTVAMRQRNEWPRSSRNRQVGGGFLEHVVWGVFFQMLSDSEDQNTETVSQIAAYVGHHQPYTGRAYIREDLRPDMGEAQQAVWEAADNYLRMAQNQEYLLRTERDNLEESWQRLINDWRALPLAPDWEHRTICDEVLRQVFELLICQMYLPGGRDEIWPRGSYQNMLGWRGITPMPIPNLQPLVPWGRRALEALIGTELVQLSWFYAEERITFSLT